MNQDEKMRESYLKFKAIEKQMRQTMQQLDFFEQQQNQLSEAITSLETLQTTTVGSEVISQFAHGIKVKTTLASNDTVLLNVGANTTVEVTPAKGIELVQEQLNAVQKYIERLQQTLHQLSEMADKVNEEATRD